MNPTRAERIATFDALRVAFETRTAQINASYEAGFIDVQAWQQDMQEQVKIMHVQAYAAGRGGKWADITQREWGAVGQRLRVQYDYLRGFAREVQQGNLSPAQMQARINLYSAAARQQFEAALSEAKGLDASALPAQPGDGTTLCMVNCKCRWAIRKRHGTYHCTWRLGRAEHCSTCLERSRKWKNLRIKDGVMLSDVETINA